MSFYYSNTPSSRADSVVVRWLKKLENFVVLLQEAVGAKRIVFSECNFQSFPTDKVAEKKCYLVILPTIRI